MRSVTRVAMSIRRHLGRFHVVVTRHIDYEPGDWVLWFDGRMERLSSKRIEDAKAEALRLVVSRLQTAIDAATAALNGGE